MNTLYKEWTLCKDCIYFDDCPNKENRDGCYFGDNDEKREAKIPKTSI